MDRSLAMLLLLGSLFSLILLAMALFAMAPIFFSCAVSLLYTLSYFLLNEKHGVHNAQEFENRFWTIFAVLLSTAAFFAKDSPIAFGWSYPSIGFLSVLSVGYGMHIWDRHMHRLEITQPLQMKKTTATSSLTKLEEMGIPIEEKLSKISECIACIDKFYLPSTIQQIVNQQFILEKEREIISIFEEAQASELNYLISHSKLAHIFYKIKDHRSFSHQHRTRIIELMGINRISQLTVHSKVRVLHALQLMKLSANLRAEYCVRNIIISTKQDKLSDLKTLMDAKGDYLCMRKLIFEDIKSDKFRDDILKHIKTQAGIQLSHMRFNTKISKKRKRTKFWRKILSDVDDTLTCSAGSYPSGIDKRFGKKVVYPGVLAFYRELDLGTDGPEEWPSNAVGNLVFLSARPHVYKDVSEKINFAKFAKLRERGMHTTPCLLAGDITSGIETLMTNDFEPLAQKKFDNFKAYASIYPEFRHVFVCDNGQGDVRAGELMVDAFPTMVEAIYVHVVQNVSTTYKYNASEWKKKEVQPYFFTTYPEAALDAARRNPPLIRVSGLRRICVESLSDFNKIDSKSWPSEETKLDRRDELNQSLWQCNQFLAAKGMEEVPLIETPQQWNVGEKVMSNFGVGTVLAYKATFDLYTIELDWRPLDVQLKAHENYLSANESERKTDSSTSEIRVSVLETVFEADDETITTIPEADQCEEIARSGKELSSISLSNDCNDRPSSPPSLIEERHGQASEGNSCRVTLTIQGRLLQAYTSPKAPIFSKEENKQEFSFFPKQKSENEKIKKIFKTGDQCNTLYGTGIICDFRENDKIYVVKMEDWDAIAYVFEDSLIKEDGSVWNSLLRIITPSETKTPSKPKRSKQKESEKCVLKDTFIRTPYGEGKIIQPNRKIDIEGQRMENTYRTSSVALCTWCLADKSHPILYCTDENLLLWKKMDDEERSKASGGILSAFGSIVSLGFLRSDKKREEMVPTEIVVPNFDRHYRDGACVTTIFGNGRVVSFRDVDGFYKVSLTNWTLANGKRATIFSRREELSTQIVNGCHEGYPVLTSLGLTGSLASIQLTTGVHIVTVESSGMVCYLQPKDIIMPLKAAVGHSVLTPFGEGKVMKYRQQDGVYEIMLKFGAMLYAPGEAFDNINSKSESSMTKMDWILSLFGGRNDPQRSRSNSITSVRTNTSKSIL